MEGECPYIVIGIVIIARIINRHDFPIVLLPYCGLTYIVIRALYAEPWTPFVSLI